MQQKLQSGGFKPRPYYSPTGIKASQINVALAQKARFEPAKVKAKEHLEAFRQAVDSMAVNNSDPCLACAHFGGLSSGINTRAAPSVLIPLIHDEASGLAFVFTNPKPTERELLDIKMSFILKHYKRMGWKVHVVNDYEQAIRLLKIDLALHAKWEKANKETINSWLAD